MLRVRGNGETFRKTMLPRFWTAFSKRLKKSSDLTALGSLFQSDGARLLQMIYHLVSFSF